jgi:hypothetical protein
MEKENGRVNGLNGNPSILSQEKGPPHPVIVPRSVYKLKYRSENGVKMFIVDGKKVRENYHMDFLVGGHHYRYDFIPEDEVWIDDAMNDDEIEPTIFHELTERSLMKEKGMDYDSAHVIANEKELEARKARNELRDKIVSILYSPSAIQSEPRLFSLITLATKLAHFRFLRDHLVFEGREFLKSNFEDVFLIEIPFKDSKDKATSSLLLELFAKLNDLEVKDKFFRARISVLEGFI